MVPDNFTQPPEFSRTLILLAELEGTMSCHLHVQIEGVNP